MSRLAVAVVAAALLALAGCTPEPAPSPAPSAAASSPADPAPTASAENAPEIISPEDFLVEGQPGVGDVWKGHYAFFTDASKAVRCDVFIFSGDSGGAWCAVTPGNESKVTYALPAVDCQPADGNGVDGYSIGINYKVFPNSNTGWTGCGLGTSEFAGVTKVLPEGQELVIESAAEKYTCSVAAGVATCTDAQGATISFGLSKADFSG